MAMQKVGDADVTFAGIDNTTGDVLLAGQMIIGMKPGISTISSKMCIRDRIYDVIF